MLSVRVRLAISTLVWMCGIGAAHRSLGQAVEPASLIDELSTNGVDFQAKGRFKLQPPLLNPGLDQSSRETLLKSLSPRIGWERMARDNPNAPTLIEIESLENESGDRVGLSVRSAYVAYAPMEVLTDAQAMHTLFGNPDSEESTMQELSTDDLKELGLSAASEDSASEDSASEDSASEDEVWAAIELPLLRKVVIRGVVRMQKSEGEDWLQFAWTLDPRFTKVADGGSAAHSDAKVGDESSGGVIRQNTWSKLAANKLGELVEGESHAYGGMAGYLRIDATGLGTNQVLIETRMLLHEPDEWFGGSRYLRSKLPLSMQENAKSFRRKLKQDN